MNIVLYNDSLKYLNKALIKVRNNKHINVPLINSINNQFLLGQGYLINTNITRVDQEQVRRIEQILIELINKLKEIKRRNESNVAPSNSAPTSSGFNSSGFNSSGFNSSGFNSSGFNSSGFNSSGFNSSGFNSSDFNSSDFNSNINVDPVTSAFSFRPGEAPLSSAILDLETCKNQLREFLIGQKVIDRDGNIINPNGLSKIAYDKFIEIMYRVKSGFTITQINDCLIQLGVKIPSS